jgi:hypothetical protein
MWDSVDFNPGGAPDVRSCAGVYDIFVTKRNANGSYDWTVNIGGTGEDQAAGGVAANDLAVVYSGGYSGTVNLNPLPNGNDPHTSSNPTDIFVTFLGDYVLLGDLNCDGRFNGADIDPFFLALGDPAAYAVAFPNCDRMVGDMNRDGQVNGADIDVFFECLAAGGCP